MRRILPDWQICPQISKRRKFMNEYVRYENMRYEMAACAEVTRQVLGLTVPVSLETLMEAMKKAGIQCVPDESLDTDTRIAEMPENPEYVIQVLYNAKINDRSLIFCLASALGEILLHRLNFTE